jgi:hypothetical protein
MQMESTVKISGPQLRHKGFGQWVIGYQNFLEPIIRASLELKLADEGFVSSARRTVGRNDLDAAANLLDSEHSRGNLSLEERVAFAAELRRRSWLQLDLAYS